MAIKEIMQDDKGVVVFRRKADQTCAFHNDLEHKVETMVKKLDKLIILVIINIAISTPKMITIIKGLF